MPFHHCSRLPASALLAAALLLPAAAHAAPGAEKEDSNDDAATTQTLAWQRCTTLPGNAERLACFDAWARQQDALLAVIQEKNQSLGESANAQPAPLQLREQVTQALASAQPATPEGSEGEEPATATASAGIVGVGLEQGCRDRQYSDLSRFWELEAGSSCPTFGLRAFHPNTVSVVHSSRINRRPTSPNPTNTASSSSDYSRNELAFHVSVRTKLASGLLTPAGSGLRDSIWAAYSQQSYWQVFNSSLSRPFRSTDHMPEIMYVYPTTARLPGGWLWRYSGIGAMHHSTGQSDPLSRSWNRVYLMTGFENGNNWQINARLWKRLKENSGDDNNPNLVRRIGRGDVSVQWRASALDTLRLTYTGFTRYGSGRLEWEHALGQGWGNSFSGLRLYTWLFHGYGETLLDYNFRRTSFGIGLSLVDF